MKQYLLFIITATVAGCAAQADSQATPPPSPWSTSTREPIPSAVPTVDTSRHSVPLEDIVFDTFRPINRAVPLPEASESLIANLVDRIPPIHNPKYEAAIEATWLNADDIVLGYTSGEEAWAYPVRILNFHEIVNDELGGEPVLISYCPLCASGVVFSRRLGDRTLNFGNTSALYESDMVMLDYATGSYWWQVAGEAIVGPLTGERLTPVPSQTVRWEAWRTLHPEARVLSRDTGYDRDYGRDPFSTYPSALEAGNFAFPVSEKSLDDRLSPAARVLVFTTSGGPIAVPLQGEAPGLRNLAEEVVFYRPDGVSAGVFRRLLEGKKLTFVVAGEGEFQDRETGSTWDLSGSALDGRLEGERLEPVPSLHAFWFSAVAAQPEIVIVRLIDG